MAQIAHEVSCAFPTLFIHPSAEGESKRISDSVDEVARSGKLGICVIQELWFFARGPLSFCSMGNGFDAIATTDDRSCLSVIAESLSYKG